MKLVVWSSLILSILHSILFYEKRLGVSVILFVITAIFIFIQILEKQGKVKNKKAYILAIPIILLSSTYFIFNNIFFSTINILAISFLFAIMLIIALLEEQKLSKMVGKIFFMVFGPFDYIEKAVKIIIRNLFNIKNEDDKDKNMQKRRIIKQILIGAVIAIPILIIVISLLTSADIIFENTLSNISYFIISNINMEAIVTLILRIAIIIILFIYLVAFILNLIKKESLFNEKEETIQNEIKDNKINIEGITLNTILTLLNVVYLIFTFTQSIYLIEQITRSGALNYAEYARTGFFQLMAVSAINFAIIFITNLNKKEVSKANKKYTMVMNILLAIFTIIILISSMVRMNLYEQKYGYTFLRLMVYFVQITELILIIPTIAYIINKKVKIIKSYMIILICAYIVINFLNIDKIIARKNIDRYFNSQELEEIDYQYLQENLSVDAISEMIRLLNAKDDIIRKSMNNYFYELKEKIEEQKVNWQEFNILEEKAKEEIKKLEIKEEYNNINKRNTYINY